MHSISPHEILRHALAFEKGFFVPGFKTTSKVSPSPKRKDLLASFTRDETYFEAIFSNAPVGIYIQEDRDKITRANQTFLKMLGYDESELVGSNGLDFTHPEDIAASQKLYLDLLTAKRSSYQLEKRYLHKKGHYIWTRITVSFTYNQEGKTPVTIVIVEDISKRKISEKQLHLSEFTLENTGDAVYWLNAEGQLNYVNPAACKMLGYERYELMSMRVQDVDPNFHEEKLHHTIAQIREENSITFESKHRHKNGKEVPVEILANHLTFEGKEYFCAFVRNITDRKRSEQELKDYTIALEHANQSLGKANQAAQAATKAKTEFLANVSHEIRTPLTAIMGYAEEFLEEKDPHKLTPLKDKATSTIKRNCKYLLNIINDILDLSKIESELIDLYLTDLSPQNLSREIQELMQIRASDKGLDLKLRFQEPIPDVIYSDPTRIRQILINLIGNAIKFTKNGQIEIIVSCPFPPKQEQDTWISFQIVDSGIGISPEDLGKLFTPFCQVDSSFTREQRGAGLGLVISQRLAKSLGGEITVKSSLGKGSFFTLMLPAFPDIRTKKNLTPPSAPRPITLAQTFQKRQSMTLSPLKILIAEDDDDSRQLIEYLLKKAGAKVDSSIDGQNALNKALEANHKKHPYDVIVLDIQMPLLTGYEVARKLRENGVETPIIALTANAMTDEKKKCLSLGFNEYISKPFERDLLLSLIIDLKNRSLRPETGTIL